MQFYASQSKQQKKNWKAALFCKWLQVHAVILTVLFNACFLSSFIEFYWISSTWRLMYVPNYTKLCAYVCIRSNHMIKIRAPHKMTTCWPAWSLLRVNFRFFSFRCLCFAFVFLYRWHRTQKVLKQKYLFYSSSWLHFISFSFHFSFSLIHTHMHHVNVHSHMMWLMSMTSWSYNFIKSCWYIDDTLK